MHRFAIVFASCVFAVSAFADNPGIIPFGDPVYSGSGCPAGSVSSLKTEEAITILFSHYNVESTGRLDAKNCQLKVPITIPAGWKAEVTSVDYRGFADVGSNAWVLLTTWFRFGKFQFGGSRPTWIKGPKQEDIFRRDVAFRRSGVKPVCGATQTSLHLSTVLYAFARKGSGATAYIDSADGALNFSVLWGRCHR